MSRKKGCKITQQHKDNIARALMGNKNGLGHIKSTKVRKQISMARKERFKKYGFLNSPEMRLASSKSHMGQIPWNKNKKMPEGMGEKMRISCLKRFEDPRNHPNWIDGKSFEPYTSAFTKQLKLRIRTLDKFTCQLCGVLEKDYFQKLSINHIDYDKNNCEESNLNSLCRSCNAKVNFNRPYWTKFFKEKILLRKSL